MLSSFNIFGMCQKNVNDPGPSTDRSGLVSEDIDRRIESDKLTLQRTYKILLLGGAASGKSTIFKQMRILHMNGFTEVDWTHYRFIIHRNIFDSLKQVLQIGRENFKSFTDDTNKEQIELFLAFQKKPFEEMINIPEEVADAIITLCQSSEVKELLALKNTLHLPDSCQYFLSNTGRILKEGFIPTVEDILRTRHPTVGIQEIQFPYKDRILRLTDVGGQKTEQRKWIRCFDNVAGILFVIDISAYNIRMEEDDIGRHGDYGTVLKQGVQLFKAIAENKCFSLRTAFIAFLNKNDIFTEKIVKEEIPIRNYFKKYRDADPTKSKYDNAITFLMDYVNQSTPAHLRREKRFFAHVTTATDTENIRVVFEDCTEAVLRANLAVAGYM